MHRKRKGARLSLAVQNMKTDEWAAGEVYSRIVFDTLRKGCADMEGVRFYLLDRKEGRTERRLEEDGVISMPYPKRFSPFWLLCGFGKLLFGRDYYMERFLKRKGIDAAFINMQQYRLRDIVTISWFPDFQHLHLPEMFDSKEIAMRNKKMAVSARAADRIVLISESVRGDFETFAPDYMDKVRVIKPVMDIPDSVYDADMQDVLKTYRLPDKFIYMPNQFWKHKNHLVVAEALGILKKHGKEAVVVCSGNKSDYRFPGYFDELESEMSKLDVIDNMPILGFVPYEHVLLLIRQSVCLLNPSLFEGWGITTCEAASLGKRSLLSDIPAHREQNPPEAVFFDPRNPDELAYRISEIWDETEPGPDLDLESLARERRPGMISYFTTEFLTMVEEALEEARRSAGIPGKEHVG